MPTCIGSVLKGLLACINFLVLACGLAVVGLGASALAGVLPLVKDWSVWIVAALMVVGGLSAILAGTFSNRISPDRLLGGSPGL